MTWLFSRAMMERYGNSRCSQGQEVESSEEICSDGGQYAPLNVMPTAHKFSRNDKTMDASNLSRFGLTCEVLTERRGEAVLMSFLEDFPARTYPQREGALGSKESEADYGLNSLASLAKYDPDTSSWKTPQFSLLGGWELFSETWPRWGTMRNGECWEREMWVLRTSETESGLWPTPTVCGNYNRKGSSATSGDGLATAVKIYPTPTAHNAKEGGYPSEHERNTPTLATHAGGPLNPTWVEWLMGWPTDWTDLRPSGTGKFQEWLQQHLPNY